MKRIVRLTVIGVMMITLFMLATTAPAMADAAKYAKLQPMTILYPHTSPKTEANALMADLIKKYAEQETGGKLTIKVMGAAQLGTAQETAQQLQDGNAQLSSEQVYSLVDFVPELSVFDMLFMFSTYNKATIDKTINEGPFNKYIQTKYNKAGFQLLGYMQGATFRETTSNRNLKAPADFKGLKIRTLPSNNFVVGWKSMGANPTPITIGELYLALQQKLVEAQENPYDIIRSNNFNEVQKYLCDTHHNLYVMHIIMNKKFYDSMPKEYREALVNAVKRARTEIGNGMPKLAEQAKKDLIKRGMTSITYSKADFDQFRKSVKPSWDSISKIAGEQTVDLLVNELEANSKKK
jgi:tripartite ATP-independent transporter DctP family solute receptor